MNHDKTTSTIGKLLDETAQRDAVHFAVAPVVAGETLRPGQHAKLDAAGMAIGYGLIGSPIGVVDPFLRQSVQPGQRFWLFLYPQTVTGMRHEWTHPAFKSEAASATPQKTASQQWLEDFANKTGWEYRELIERLRTAATRGSVHAGDDDTADQFSENRAELFRHYSIVTGEVVTSEQIERVYFSCAC